jgi:hypothetical protein
MLLRQAFHPRDRPKADAVREKLEKKFGTSTLSGGTAEELAKRILKRGRIKNHQECDRMREFLTEYETDDAIGAENALQLEGLVVAWERGAT